MADITFTTTFSVSKGTLKEGIQRTTQIAFVATAPLMAAGIPSIGFASHEALVMQDVASAGWAFFENLDGTNFVRIGIDSTGTFIPFLKLLPGESMCVRLATNAPYAKADTAAVQLNYKIYQA